MLRRGVVFERMLHIFQCMPITNLKSHKDLGLYITEDLSWDLHLSESTKKANTAFLVIKRNFPKLSMSTTNLYKSMIISIITHLSCCFYKSIKSTSLFESLIRKYQKSKYCHPCNKKKFSQTFHEHNEPL